MYEQQKWDMRAEAGRHLGADAARAPVHVFRALARGTAKVSLQRKAALRAHLKARCAAASNEPARSPGDPQDACLATRQDAAGIPICAQCRGHCCREGGDHGYLTAQTMARVRSLPPEGTSVLDHYMSFVPSRSYKDSCIFHTARGCALDRELRSDTCIRYLCRPLRDVGKNSGDFIDRPSILVFEVERRWQRVFIARGSSLTEMRATKHPAG